MLVARLHAPVHKEGVKYTGLFSVEFDGEIVVVCSRDPEHDAARALLAKGITGKLAFVDAQTSEPRTFIDIEKAAKRTVRENRRDGPRFAKWEPMSESAFQRTRGRSPTPEDEVVLPTMPPEANQAA
jgi:hypothetical protein